MGRYESARGLGAVAFFYRRVRSPCPPSWGGGVHWACVYVESDSNRAGTRRVRGGILCHHMLASWEGEKGGGDALSLTKLRHPRPESLNSD